MPTRAQRTPQRVAATMRLLELTLPTPAENLALDEALLDAAEAGELADEVLRLWEPAAPFVVLGRSSLPGAEVQLAACRRDGVPVVRRSSGGGTVVTGPGSLMYGVVLSMENRPELRMVDQAHRFVLGQLAAALEAAGVEVVPQGTSDLATPADGALRKISGNSLRIKRAHLLYHGTMLYDFNLSQLDRWLGTPARMPEYRRERSHVEFVTNLPVDRQAVVDAIIDAWNSHEPLVDWPKERTQNLAAEKFSHNHTAGDLPDRG